MSGLVTYLVDDGWGVEEVRVVLAIGLQAMHVLRLRLDDVVHQAAQLLLELHAPWPRCPARCS